MEAAKCVKLRRYTRASVNVRSVKISRMGTKCDLCDFNCGMVVASARWNGFSETTDLLELYQFLEFKQNGTKTIEWEHFVHKRGQRIWPDWATESNQCCYIHGGKMFR